MASTAILLSFAYERSLLSLQATVADTQQLEWWLLGLGDGVKVIKPLALRNKIADTIEKMSQLYRETVDHSTQMP